MAKKKGATLSELNEFLKKDPNSLADIDKLSEAHEAEAASIEVTVDAIAGLIKQLARKENISETTALLQVIQNSLEQKTEESSSDILLMNIALYLEHAEKTGERLNQLMKG